MRHALTTCLLLACLAGAGEEQSPSAFAWRTNENVKCTIDRKEIIKGIRGADPRDGIPAIRKPRYLTANEAALWLGSRERVLGVVVGKEARAYPLRILERHEMVNDVLGGRPIGPNY
jgi:hypothetical protein